MRKARDMVLKSRWVGVDELAVPAYYADLYPLPRDLAGLRRSFERHGYRPEYPLVARPAAGSGGALEIVCGVGRLVVARERGMRRVPAVVRRFGTDEGARAYAIEDNLFGPSPVSRLSLAHRIVLARALKACGVECKPGQVWEAAGVSPSTYRRAEAGLRESLGRLLADHPELEGLDPARQVAEIVRRELDPRLTRLLAGEIEVNTHHRSLGRRGQPSVGAGDGAGAGAARESEPESRATTIPQAQPGTPTPSVAVTPEQPDAVAVRAEVAGADGRKQDGKQGAPLPLFD